MGRQIRAGLEFLIVEFQVDVLRLQIYDDVNGWHCRRNFAEGFKIVLCLQSDKSAIHGFPHGLKETWKLNGRCAAMDGLKVEVRIAHRSQSNLHPRRGLFP